MLDALRSSPHTHDVYLPSTYSPTLHLPSTETADTHRHQSAEQVRSHFDGGAMALATSGDALLEGGGLLLGPRLGGAAGRVSTSHFEGGSMVLDGPSPCKPGIVLGGGVGGKIGGGPPWRKSGPTPRAKRGKRFMPPPPDAVARRAAAEAAAAARGSPSADALALLSTRGGKKRPVRPRARSGGARSALMDEAGPWRATGLARNEPAPCTARGGRDGVLLRATPRLRGSGALSGAAAAAARRGHFAGGDFTLTPRTCYATVLAADAAAVAAANAQVRVYMLDSLSCARAAPHTL